MRLEATLEGCNLCKYDVHRMQLSSVDLNLLVALDALLEEGSVTGAARRVALSPSAMSHALARLRAILDDPILVRTGSRMVPTDLARDLRLDVRMALDHARAAFATTFTFDPSHYARIFRVSAPDDVQVMVLPHLLRRLAETAPGVEIDMSPGRGDAETFKQLEGGGVDAAIGPFSKTPRAIRAAVFFETRIACLVRRGHPRIGDELTLEAYLAEDHIAIAQEGGSYVPIDLDRIIERARSPRRVVARVSSLQVAPLVVAQTDLICTAAERVIAGIASCLPLRMFPHPLDIKCPRSHLIWHERAHRHPAHRWFRSLLLDVAGAPNLESMARVRPAQRRAAERGEDASAPRAARR